MRIVDLSRHENPNRYLEYYKISEGDIILDIGAHLGEETIPWSKMVGETGEIISIEPNPIIFETLKNNTNHLNNVICLMLGIFDEDGTKDLAIRVTSSSCGYIGDYPPIESYYKNSKIITLDSLIKELKLNSIDFLKMDIEGSEIKALEGGKEAFKIIKQVAIEGEHPISPGHKLSKYEVAKILKEYNFDVKTEDNIVYGSNQNI